LRRFFHVARIEKPFNMAAGLDVKIKRNTHRGTLFPSMPVYKSKMNRVCRWCRVLTSNFR
jgi:hypothetical protein